MGARAEWEALGGGAAAAAAPLVGMGCRSGDVLVGLSAVRESKGLALVFADARLSEGSRRQLALGCGRSARLYILEDLGALTQRIGRPDVRVLGVRPGALAAGIAGKLAAAAEAP